MNLKGIKEKARQTVSRNKDIMVRVALIVLLLGSIPGLFNAGNNNASEILQQAANGGTVMPDTLKAFYISSSIVLILTIIMLPIGQGNITNTMKAVTNRESEMNIDDALTGIKRFGELFMTYLAKVLYLIAFTLVPFIGATFLVALLITAGLQLIALMALFVLFILVIVLFIYNVLSVFPMCYLLEEKKASGFGAIKPARELMQNHHMELLKLFLSYILWFIAQLFIQMVIAAIVAIPLRFMIGKIMAATIGNMTGLIGSVIFAAYTFYPELQTSLTIFYEELMYRSQKKY